MKCEYQLLANHRVVLILDMKHRDTHNSSLTRAICGHSKLRSKLKTNNYGMLPMIRIKKFGGAGSRTRVTSMGGLYDAATLRARSNAVGHKMHERPSICLLRSDAGFACGRHWLAGEPATARGPASAAARLGRRMF